MQKWIDTRWFESEFDDDFLSTVHGTLRLVAFKVRILAFLDKLICTIFLKFGIQQTAVTDDDLPDSVLLEQKWIGFLILFGVFVAQVLEHDCLFALWAWVQMLKWLVIRAT